MLGLKCICQECIHDLNIYSLQQRKTNKSKNCHGSHHRHLVHIHFNLGGYPVELGPVCFCQEWGDLCHHMECIDQWHLHSVACTSGLTTNIADAIMVCRKFRKSLPFMKDADNFIRSGAAGLFGVVVMKSSYYQHCYFPLKMV